MPKKLVTKQSDVSTYPQLLGRVKATLIEGKRRIEAEKIRTYWETGRLIQMHILHFSERAEYAAEVILRLSKDLNVNDSLLHRCVKFAKTYPKVSIVALRPQFTWTHYRELISIPDDKERLRLEIAVEKSGLTVEELQQRKKLLFSEKEEPLITEPTKILKVPEISSQKLLIPLRGTLYTYQIMKRKTVSPQFASELVVDLGFSIVRNVEAKLLTKFSDGEVVESVPKEDAYKFVKSGKTVKDLYTYNAIVEKVIDADTLKVHVDLGFDTWTRQTLRLRGIDAPELGTKEGEAAKAFVQSLIKEASSIVIRSSRSDKYDRYLADVFIPLGETSSPETDIYLNNLLLEKGFAKRMDV